MEGKSTILTFEIMFTSWTEIKAAFILQEPAACRTAPTAADVFSPKTKEAASALPDIMVTTVIKVGFRSMPFPFSSELDRILSGFKQNSFSWTSLWSGSAGSSISYHFSKH